MAGAAFFVIRGDHPDIVGELLHDIFQHLNPRRVDTVVVGDQNAAVREGLTFNHANLTEFVAAYERYYRPVQGFLG